MALDTVAVGRKTEVALDAAVNVDVLLLIAVVSQWVAMTTPQMTWLKTTRNLPSLDGST